MSMTIGLTGCSVIETDVQNPITDIFDEYGIDYNSFSEPTKKALNNIHAEHFFEATEKNDDGFSVSIEALSGVYSLMTENELEAAALLNASYEDIIIQYDISVTNANAAAIYYAIEEYSSECIRNDKPIKAGDYINKVSVNSGNSNINYNGKTSDLKHFIDNVINYEARGGYYYVKVNDFGFPLAVYWSKEKSAIKNEDDLTSFYRYDYEEYQDGEDIVGAYPVTFTMKNGTLGRVMKKTVLANEESRDVDEFEDMILYGKLVELFEDEVDYNISSLVNGNNEEQQSIYVTERITEQNQENITIETEENNVQNINAVNPFEGLKIELDGASPYLKASVNTAECNNDTKEHVRFSVTEEPLKLGDSVTVTAEWNDDCGIEFSQSSMEYAVENTAYYLDSLDGVDLSELNQLMDDYVEAEANKYVNDSVIFGIASHHEPWYNGEAFTIGYNPIVTGIGKINVSNNYFLSLKQSSSLYRDEVYNKYMGIYEVEYSTYRKATDEYSNNTAILAVFIDNIVMDTDGTLKYNSTENLNSKMFYREVEDTIAIIESNYVIAEKAQYNVTQIK